MVLKGGTVNGPVNENYIRGEILAIPVSESFILDFDSVSHILDFDNLKF